MEVLGPAPGDGGHPVDFDFYMEQAGEEQEGDCCRGSRVSMATSSCSLVLGCKPLGRGSRKRLCVCVCPRVCVLLACCQIVGQRYCTGPH